jgi:hypothetical protein
VRLFDEYLQRHNLSYIGPRHCSSGALILRADPTIWNHHWLLIKIKWLTDVQHPGTYQIHFDAPIHNSENLSSCFSNELNPITLQWDEYDNWLLDWAGCVQSVEPIARKTKRGWEVILVLWEIFVFCFDNWFSQQSSIIKEKLFQSLDEEETIKLRYKNYQEILLFLQQQFPNIWKIWNSDFLEYYHNYSDWLVTLLRKNEKL